jgi:hypothetical protein
MMLGTDGYSPGHTHAKSAFIYATVLEGAIRSQVNDAPVTIYKAGQSWSELPGDAPMPARRSRPSSSRCLVDTNETADDPIREQRCNPRLIVRSTRDAERVSRCLPN